MEILLNEKSRSIGPGEERRNQLLEKYTGRWVWRAVAAMIDLPDTGRSARKMAEKLGVDLGEVVDALEGLEDLELIERRPEGYLRKKSVFEVTDGEVKPKAMMRDHALVSSQILSRLNPKTPALQHFYRTSFCASNRALVQEFCLKFENLLREFVEKSAHSEADEVYAVSFTGLNVTESLKERSVS